MPADPLSRVLVLLKGVKQQGQEHLALCPAHDDRTPSLSVRQASDGQVLIHCHAGCSVQAVVGALGLQVADLFTDRAQPNGGTGREIVATYDYQDEAGNLLYQTVRFLPKDFRQRRPDGRGGWLWKLDGARRVLFRLPEVIAAVTAGQTVWITEGEKDALELVRVGVCATCNPMGAGKWRPEYGKALRGATVVVVADRDAPGRAHALEVQRSLVGIARSCRVVEAAFGKDAADHIAAGKTVAEFVPIADDPAQPEARRPGEVSASTEKKPSELVIVKLSDVVERKAEYLWSPRLPKAMFVELGGDPGSGKTFLASELVASNSRGRWPGGEATEPTASVILGAEDSLEMVLKPRLRAAGANMEMVTAIKGARGPDGGLDDVLLERHYAQVRDHILSVRAGLVYFDCLADALGDHDSNSYSQTRRAMRFLPRLAEETGATIVATRHMKKSGDGTAWKQSVGSVGYSSRSRVTLQVYADREDPTRRILACALHRLAVLPPSLAFRLEGGDDNTPPHIGWIGEDHRSADDLAAEASKMEREAPAVDRAEAWLTERLASGPVESKAVFAEGKSLGLSRSSLYRAAAALSIHKETEPPGGFASGRSSTWSLPSHTFQENGSSSGTDRNINNLAHTFPHPGTETYGNAKCPACGNLDALQVENEPIACPGCNPIAFAKAAKERISRTAA